MNSQTLRHLSNEEFKFSSDLTQKSKEESDQANSNIERRVRPLKVSRVFKKGLFFYNQRIMTLTSAPKLSYISGKVERVISLDSRTIIKQLGEKMFEITNFEPVKKFRFKTLSAADCEEWVVMLRKMVQNFVSF